MVSTTSLTLLASILPTFLHAQNTTSQPETLSNQTKEYKPLLDASGAVFFAHFNVFTWPDPTHRHVNYATLADADSTGLIGIISSTSPLDGAVYIGVDHVNPAPNGRRSIRLESKATFNHHLLVADIQHIPSVCGVWPALWQFGPDPWPTHGEIDILEVVHNSTANRMSLHTQNELIVANKSESMRGRLQRANCGPDPENIGCTVLDGMEAGSAGRKFNDLDGGVYASEFSDRGMSIWFFPRSNIPTDIAAGAPDPRTWGTPNALFNAAGGKVDWNAYFSDLRVIINTTFCGAWAGKVWAEGECAHLADT